MSDDKDDDNELVFAVKAVERSLPKGTNHHIGELLAFLVGMAPFLDRDTLIDLKCQGCDNYASSFYPVESDLDIVEFHGYCHAKKQMLHHQALFTIAKCMEYSNEVQKELQETAEAVVEDDLRPGLAGKKLYDRKLFASYDVEFRIKPRVGENVSIEFGHKTNGDFVDSGIRICLLKRLDPELCEHSAKIVTVQNHGRTTMVVMIDRQIRRQLGVDEILEKIAETRDMDIVYI
ncbi:MAG: hypothetical protein U9N48_03265 [Euryarchaeota archaeon]|nr:hypothetical protein [Euryarchaeota archaeon]